MGDYIESLRTTFCPKCHIETQHHMRYVVYARVPDSSVPEHYEQKIHFQFEPKEDLSYIPAIVATSNQVSALQIYVDDVPHDFLASICIKCHNVMIWKGNEKVYPIDSAQEQPHPDMPEEIRKLYEEAASISVLSPRACLVIIRYAIESLLRYIGSGIVKEGDKLVYMIAELHKAGKIDSRIKEASDCIRLLGNEAAHDDIMTIELEDLSEIEALFKFVNFIVDYTISIDNKMSVFQKKLEQ